VSTYLWTKSIAAGALLVAAFGGWDPLYTLAAPAIGLLFLLLTTALLILDLKRPDRFLYILVKPNWRSWLVWGSWILLAFGGAGTVWFLGAIGGRPDLISLVTLPVVPLALAAAGYSAFLFGQADGRDFWQSALVLPHLVLAAVLAGAAALIVPVALLAPPERAEPCGGGVLEQARCLDRATLDGLLAILLVTLVLHVALLALELFSRHAVHDAGLAARLITRGAYRRRFWAGVVGGGIVAPLALALAAAAFDSGAVAGVAALLALAGLWLWEDVWVRAGQSVPLS
jgi:Ni/Fe-hydrogenase subunit HybB-like protein